MSTGTVKFFNDIKVFGCIIEEGSNKAHFVHISGLIDEIGVGDRVEFDLTDSKKGLNAVNVKVIKYPLLSLDEVSPSPCDGFFVC